MQGLQPEGHGDEHADDGEEPAGNRGVPGGARLLGRLQRGGGLSGFRYGNSGRYTAVKRKAKRASPALSS
ncbi:hypothetical protein FHR33_001171 [Nonomuraea dietziae]|uniref:Uncharacterized protein n=1 Tax=Nonomuraea dietziae TaxID=65515 RepID=A0A7W5UVB1_9ACTN|nr:hypothetical protein [Nonomuraea dietziae]